MFSALPTSPAFDDVLDLGVITLKRRRGIVFCGRSGAGKSSAIRYLIEQHPAFARQRAELDVIEELYDWRDAGRFVHATLHRRPLLIASHWPVWLHRLLAPLSRVWVIDLDRAEIKIRRALQNRGIAFSNDAVASFCAAFGANYTDLGIVLERYPDLRFDQAWQRFQRECAIREHKPS